jgi:hypothetical protein
MLKYLRIAVTALSLTACVLLIALWVRSYWWWDTVFYDPPDRPNYVISEVNSVQGRVSFARYDNPFGEANGWGATSDPVDRDLNLEQFLFKRHEATGDRDVIVPYWFPILCAGTLAIVPWIPWRFSLRTLLIATALMAVGLGVVVISS